MRGVSLFAVLCVAKLLGLYGRDLPFSAGHILAYFWQDAAVVLVYLLLERLLGKRWSLVPYAAIAFYTAANVPIIRVLSTPMTPALFRATGGALSDSILRYATPGNLFSVTIVLLLATVLPMIFRRASPVLFAVLLTLIAAGPAAVGRVETIGLHRTAVAVLVLSSLPRVATAQAAASTPWRNSPFDESGSPDSDLTFLRGAASGFNVLHVILESTASQYLRNYGAAEDPMPGLTSLSKRAVVFENAYAAYPESIKGLYSVLCGSYPAPDTKPKLYESSKTPSFAAALESIGYRTAMFHSGRFAYLGMESIIYRRGYQLLEDAGHIGGNHASSFGISDERVTVKRILGWLDTLPRGQRFLVSYLPIAGHHPYASPDQGPFPNHREVDNYRNALHHADAGLALLLAGLRERGLDRNTLIVLHGDHGQAFGQHAGNYAHSFFLYEENVRVPLMVVLPGLQETRVKRSASLVDVAPTILDLVGLAAPKAYQGSSLLAAERRLTLFFTDYSLPLLGLRDGKWKFVYDGESGRTKLFDLDRDAGEKMDLSAQHPERVSAYTKRLIAWSSSQRAALRLTAD